VDAGHFELKNFQEKILKSLIIKKSLNLQSGFLKQIRIDKLFLTMEKAKIT